MPRPAPRFHGFIGQHSLLKALGKELAGAKVRSEPVPHVLLMGQSGVGKTTLAEALAAEMGTRVARTFGIVSVDRLARKLVSLGRCDFLFIDEAHNLKADAQELLFQAIDKGCVRIARKPNGPTRKRPVEPFTLVLATDRPGRLLDALRKRIPNPLHLRTYHLAEMREIVSTIAADKGVLLSPQATGAIAKVCHGLPRKAQHLIAKLRLTSEVKSEQLSIGDVRCFLKANGIDRHGLGRLERAYLRRLLGLGRASVATLAQMVEIDRDEVQWQIEPVLVRKGLITIGPSGRTLTERAKKLLDKHPTRSSCAGASD